MAEYVEKEKTIKLLTDSMDAYGKFSVERSIYMTARQKIKNIPAADVAPVVHGIPVLCYRPERYEWYEATGLNENGEPLYVKRVRIDEKSWAMYCLACGKRLCSRFNNYCPNCGAKMDGGKSNGKT